MASPQTEHGYTRIANEIMERLSHTYLASNEWQVLFAILRLTYGYGKKEDTISLSQLNNLTGIDRRHVHRAAKSLSLKRVIVVTRMGDSVTRMGDKHQISYRFNKDYDQWCHLYGRQALSPKRATNLSPVRAPSKEKKEKEYLYSSQVSKNCQCPHQKIIDLYHDILPELRAVKIWSEDRRKMLQRRWKESEKRQTLDWWKTFFAYVRDSEFLMGSKTDFQADLEWLVRPKNFVKVVEGKYHR